jgi:DNA-binding winged helix-turn-helix (wHTH) protein
VLLRSGREVPLVPRYLDLLLFLLERRNEAVHRRDIMDGVWSDVVVSDGALSQAVRSLRRALGDDSRDPRFVRTVSRHGYQFVFADVSQEADDGPLPTASGPTSAVASGADSVETLVETLLGGADDDSRREAAEALHVLGTGETLRRIEGRPGAAVARALLRDARWDVPQAGAVPLRGRGGFGAALALLGLRLRHGARAAGERWLSAAEGGAIAGFVGGLFGGFLLYVAPGSHATPELLGVFSVIGAIIGATGASGVGAGLAGAEAVARSFRGAALVALGSLGGGLVGAAAHTLGRWTLQGLFGHDLSTLGGGFEGLVIGGAAGLGYSLSTPRDGGGMASPRGAARIVAAVATGVCCAAAAIALTFAGGHLGGVSLDLVARSFESSQAGLAPIGGLFGEADLGPKARAFLAAYEGGLFGLGLVLGLTRRPSVA